MAAAVAKSVAVAAASANFHPFGRLESIDNQVTSLNFYFYHHKRLNLDFCTTPHLIVHLALFGAARHSQWTTFWYQRASPGGGVFFFFSAVIPFDFSVYRWSESRPTCLSCCCCSASSSLMPRLGVIWIRIMALVERVRVIRMNVLQSIVF